MRVQQENKCRSKTAHVAAGSEVLAPNLGPAVHNGKHATYRTQPVTIHRYVYARSGIVTRPKACTRDPSHRKCLCLCLRESDRGVGRKVRIEIDKLAVSLLNDLDGVMNFEGTGCH